jgi:CRP-like cAMP-binding protein
MRPRRPDAPRLPVRGWLADADPEFRSELLARARPRTCAAGTSLYVADSTSREVCGVVSGVVEVHGRLPHPEAAVLHFMHPGHWFGSSPVTARRPRRVMALARTDVELLVVAGDELLAMLAHRPDWWPEIGRETDHAFDVAMQAAGDLLIRDAAARCAAVLLRLADRRWPEDPDHSLPNEVPATQSELAMACNVARNTFGEVLRRSASAGWVRGGYRSVVVVDPDALRRLADGG